MWLDQVIQIFKIKDLRNKIIFVIGVFAVFRIMANIPIPGIDAQNLRALLAQLEFQPLRLLNVFTGGALDKLSIVMLGLGPYITAVIILQLLTMIFPQFEKMYKEEGEAGRQKFNQYGRIMTVPLSILQGYSMLILLSRQGVILNLTPDVILASVFTIAGASLFLMWLGELITEKGIGNGVSLLIFAGIVADFPNNLRQIWIEYDPTRILDYAVFFASVFAIMAGVVLVQEARRNIPVSYAKRVRGTRMYGGVSTYLPLNVNPAGVIPIIFAISLLTFPLMMANFFVGPLSSIGAILTAVGQFLQISWVHGLSYFFMVFLFTFFYTAVTFDPKSIASNLQKMGGFVPGIRPGNSTANFISYILNRVLPIGALFLGVIAVLPSVVVGFTRVSGFNFLVGGTSVLIMVSVALETLKQIQAQLKMREYETF